MKDYEIKAGKFEREVRDNNLEDVFRRVDIDSGTVFVAEQNMNNSLCRITILFDDSVFSVIHLRFARLDNVARKDKILNLFNDLHGTYKLYRFFVDNDNDICADLCYMSNGNDFNAAMFFALITTAFSQISEEVLPKVMRVMYA